MILRTENLHKSFGGVYAVRGVNLSVAEHRIHAIIGPNGAGKSTLLAQLAGALAPDRGKIFFEGDDITGVAQHRRARLGLVRSFQITSVVSPMTLLENVTLAVQATAGHAYRFWSPVAADAELRDRAMHHLAGVGLADRAGVTAADAAHGEQRRLELAMALALQPKLLLLDEPMAGMSREESAAMIELLANLRADAGVALVEHDMDAVFTLADTASVLVGGRIIADGGVDEVRADQAVQRAYLGKAR